MRIRGIALKCYLMNDEAWESLINKIAFKVSKVYKLRLDFDKHIYD